MEKISFANQQKFSELKKLNLPVKQYFITGSGALGIRNLREIGDIDIIVTMELWDFLAAQYGITTEKGTEKIVFPGNLIEAFREGSFHTESPDRIAPSFAERFSSVEIIDGLPFENLRHVLYYKRKMGREKDLKDIQLIRTLLA